MKLSISGRSSRYTVSKALLIAACAMFSVSFLFPFMRFPVQFLDSRRYLITYWSYKSVVEPDFRSQAPRTELSFGNYWFYSWYYPPSPQFLGLPWVLVSMFSAQVITFLTGFVSLFTKWRHLPILSAVACLLVASTMIYTWTGIQNYIRGFATYELGYWVTYLSATMWLIAYAMQRSLPKEAKKPI